jgi:hypothetical protein
MIYNIVCPALTSKLLKSLNAVKFVVRAYIILNWHFIKHQGAGSNDLYQTSASNSWALMPVLKCALVRRDCEVRLNGRGMSVWRVRLIRAFKRPPPPFLLPSHRSCRRRKFLHQWFTFQSTDIFQLCLYCISFLVYKTHSSCSEYAHKILFFLDVKCTTVITFLLENVVL